MAAVLRSGAAFTFPLPDEKVPALAATYDLVVKIGEEVLWESDAPASVADAVAAGGITFPEAASVIPGVNAFARFKINFRNAAGLAIGGAIYEVIIEANDLLRPLTNSFATWDQFQLESQYMVGIAPYKFASEEEQKAALINAYYAIGDVHVDFCPSYRRARYHDQSRMWDASGIFEGDIERIYSTRQLKEETWAKIPALSKEKLMRAQLIEANFLLSGLTPEKQRLSGLMSHSAGESAHFYRTTKPLELPVCRATALALKGIISYVVRIAG